MTQKRPFFLLLAAFLFIPTFTFGLNNPGTTAMNFVNLSHSAKAESLGRAQTAVTGVRSFTLNSASVASQENAEVTAQLVSYVQDVSYKNLGVVYPTPWGVIAVDAGAIDYGSQTRTTFSDRAGDSGDTFTNSAYQGAVAIAKKYHDMNVGIGVRYTSETLDGNKMDAAGLNVGFQKALLPNWTIAAAVNNLTIKKAKATFSGTTADLPTEVRFGFLHVALLNLRKLYLSFDLIKSNDSDISIGFGAQYNLISNLDVRAGYNNLSEIAPVSLGLGLKMSYMNVDFSYLPSDDFGPTYRIGLGLEL